jgi:hypothetical protein
VTGAVLLAVLAIEVHSPGDCPLAADVERRLAPLLDAAAGLRDVAIIRHPADGTLLVSLADAAGQPIGERRFPRAGACADQAETVAVTLAIWEAQLHPEITLRLDRLAPATVADTPVLIARPAASPPRPPMALSLGVAAAGDWQPGSWAPAGRIELGLGRDGGRWRAQLALLGFGRHVLDVGPGQAVWWRAAVNLGADAAVLRGQRAALTLGGGALVGVASISGRGFTVDRTSRSVDAGGEVRLRAARARGLVRPWAGLSLAAWLRRQALDLEGVATAGAALPRVEPTVAVGADFVW